MASLSEISVRDFRNISDQRLVFARNLNVIVGRNGSGKSSLLEAVSVLGTGKAFTGATASEFVSKGRQSSVVTGSVKVDGGHVAVGIEKTRSTTTCRVNAHAVKSASSLASYMPLVSLDSQLFQMAANAPAYRRAILDRTLFHVEPGYLALFQRYFRALQNRNQLIRRDSKDDEFRYWTEEFVEHGRNLDGLRRKCVAQLNCNLSRTENSTELGDVSLAYAAGWRDGIDLEEAVAESRDRERLMGATTCGPHRAGLKILLNGLPVRHTTSRGQAKLIACLIAEAQIKSLETDGKEPPILLVDDLCAELDRDSQQHCLGLLLKENRQIFITAISLEDLPIPSSFYDVRKFHVKHGVFTVA